MYTRPDQRSDGTATSRRDRVYALMREEFHAALSQASGNRALTESLVPRQPARPRDTVEEGQPIVRLEAMKPEVVVRAPRAGTVSGIQVAPGQHLDPGRAMAVITQGGAS
ncbi:hypothetical protein BJF83_14175 [Nocardiopsis sp. CNR-923]|uniref:acetyl-CoA carboxylase biotin carboxyl carrier protein subunit n=1 Tax=Nocardiopsis sp. CNR-923 TaxID=1904965 RepID=UPI000959FCCE|nr:acetyl-CoA carboxylase biotin carboxyl carrier protein subunit [Nocardiopsis sp. CNR-923]OLT28778.1 hypothetical protein BJF83_14175 [Nocardiopsis sp. CNR-923]